MKVLHKFYEITEKHALFKNVRLHRLRQGKQLNKQEGMYFPQVKGGELMISKRMGFRFVRN